MQEMINKMYTLARVLKLKAPVILLTVYIFFLASMFMVKKRSSNLPIQLGVYEVSHNFRTSLQSSMTYNNLINMRYTL